MSKVVKVRVTERGLTFKGSPMAVGFVFDAPYPLPQTLVNKVRIAGDPREAPKEPEKLVVNPAPAPPKKKEG